MAPRSPLNAGPGTRRNSLWTAPAKALVALIWCVQLLTPAQAAKPPAMPDITIISLEKNCFGCIGGSLLVLRRDGTATLTVTGSARSGTTDVVSNGIVRREDFDALAQFAQARGFFSLDDSYDDPAMRDGAWSTTSIGHGGAETPLKRVFRRENAGPHALEAVETAIESLKARITFTPERR